MRELTLCEQQEIMGGAMLEIIIVGILGAGLYKLCVTNKGRISIPKLITVEWRN